MMPFSNPEFDPNLLDLDTVFQTNAAKIKLNKNYTFKIFPLYLMPLQLAFQHHETKDVSGLGKTKKKFEKTFSHDMIDADQRVAYLLFKRGLKDSSIIEKWQFFIREYEDIYLEISPYVSDFMHNMIEEMKIEDEEDDDQGNSNLYKLFPTYEKKFIDRIIHFLSFAIVATYFEHVITHNTALEQIFKGIEQAKKIPIEMKEKLRNFLSAYRELMVRCFPSLRNLHFSAEKEYKLAFKRNQGDEPEFVNVLEPIYLKITESQLLQLFLEDMPSTWKKGEKHIDNVKLNVYSMGEIYAEYLILYQNYVSISSVFPFALTLVFDETIHLAPLLKAITHSGRQIDSHLKGNTEISGNARNIKTKAKERLIQLPSDSHALSAFSFPLLVKEFGHSLSKDGHATDKKFDDVLTTSQLIDLFFSQNISALELSFVDRAMHEKIPFEQIEHLLSPNGELYEQTGIKEIAVYLSKQHDRTIIEKILRQSSARIFVGLHVLVKELKSLEEALKKIQYEKRDLQKELQMEKNSNVRQVEQKEEIAFLKGQLEHSKNERNVIQKSFHDVSRSVAPFQELELRYEEAHEDIQRLEEEKKDLLLENDRLTKMLQSYTENMDDIVIAEEMTAEAYLQLHLADYLTRKIAVIGGHEKWRTRISQLFPNARIFIPEHLNVSLEMIASADLVIFNSATTNHSIFEKMKEPLRRNKHGQMVYINTSSSNMLRTLTVIHKQLEQLADI